MENNINQKTILKMYRYMKDGMSIESFMTKFGINYEELTGLLKLCNIYGKEIEIVPKGDTYIFKKNSSKLPQVSKPDIDDDKIIHKQICVVSDTHFGNNNQQLHLVNEIYQEAYNRGIDTVLHIGDIVDGNYPNRPENPRLQFLHGFDEQAGYVVDNYPRVDGMKTYYILGSHDESHYKNGQATVNEWLSRCRPDMVYMGQDIGEFYSDKVKILMDHPGGGSSQSLSYKPQKRVEILEPHYKPKIMLIGHYHKSFTFNYRNVQVVLVPSLCAKTQFQQKQGLSNVLGAYFLDIYSTKNGYIEYFEPEEILYGPEHIWDEQGKDKRKVKKLVIDHGIYE